MAQLKDLIVTGASRFIGDVIANQIQITTLKAPIEAGGSSYGTGSNGQVLLSNGSSVYWGSAAPTVTESTVSGWGFTKNTGTVTSITPGNGLLNGTGTTAITTSGTLNLSYGTSATAIGTAAAGTANTVSRSDHVHNISLATGDANGQVKIAGTNVSVKGLGSNAYTSTAYLPLAGGTMTGGVTYVGNQSSAWNDKGILFTNGSRIGENTSGQLGLYSANKFYIRPQSGTASSGKGIEIDNTFLIPSTTNEMSLGDSTHKWTTVYAATFDGNATTATTASKLGTANKGSTTKPIYLAAGVATECSTYAGGTAVTLNGTSKAASTASFYAPTGAGTSGQYLKSSGNGAPTWDSITTTDEKVKQTAKTDNVNYKILLTASASPTSGSAAEATYDANITINPSTHTITATNFSGTATKATGDADGNTISSTYLKKSGGDMLGMLGLKGIKGTSGTDYGDELPDTGTEGQLFFLVDDGSNIATGLSNTVNLQASLSDSTVASFDGTQTGTLTIGTTGTLPVSKGGTGATSFTANSVIMSGSSTTAALTTRAVTNNTSNTAITGSTNIPTMNTIYYGLATINGSSQSRATAIYAPTAAGAQNSILVSNGSGAPGWKATTAGVAYVSANAGALTFGTAPVNLGGTGATTFISGNVLVGNGTSAITTIGKDTANTASTLVQRDSDGNFSAGTITANLTGVASKATAANITTNTNAIAKYSNTTGSFASIRSASGALYATAQDGAPTFGTLPIAQGGTGATSAAAARTGLGITAANVVGTGTAAQFYRGDNTWSDTISGGLLKVTNNSNTVTIGSQNTSACHIYNSANIPFAFNKGIFTTAKGNLGTTTYPFGQLYLGRATADSKALNSANPLLEFSNSDRSQYCQLIYTDYNNQGGSDSLNLVSNQTDCRFTAPKIFGAVWNDYAEFRETLVDVYPGQCVVETGAGDLVPSTDRLQGGAEIISDTYGFGIGETKKCKTPIASTGRVLAYPLEDKNSYQPGDAVCSGPNGTISKMTREEIREWPDRIIGTVSEIPNYNIWYAGVDQKKEIIVDGRIWIRIR